jgi:hypothetical protein
MVPPPEAGAIPAFARRYKISCTTCHAPIPKLKAYGDEFAGNGFVIPEEEKERDYVSAGDDLLHLNRDFPVAVRFDAYAVYNDAASIKEDLQTPWGLKLLSGGALAKDVGYYFYFYLSERGEIAGIEDAIVHFNDVLQSNLDVVIGQFQTSDPLMKRELRLTYEDYLAYKQRVGFSGTDLTYDRGIMLTYGIAKTGTDLVAMLVNGNGKGDAGQDRIFDGDRHKNVGIRASQALGDQASVGGFFYYGKESIDIEVEDTGDPEASFRFAANNEITYWGPDLNIAVGPLELTGQYLLRTDTEPAPFMQDVETSGLVAELIFAPQRDRSRDYLTVLYNLIDSDLDADDYESLTLSGTHLLARNLRLVAEYTRDLKNDRNRILLGTVSAF